MKIKPKLYLNSSPQTAEEGSLAFARNMKVDNDGNLVSDFGYTDIDIKIGNTDTYYTIIGHIVGLDNKIYLFTSDVIEGFNNIIEYDELTKSYSVISGAWKYSGGKITGCVNTNISGEKILTIGEYDATNNVDVPLKHINISNPSFYNSGEESLFCQAPKVPILNLEFYNTYIKTIPAGVYVFFVRYKIRKDVYTGWYLCSRPIFAGTKEKINTLQGGVQYINTHKDASKSFIFQPRFVNSSLINAGYYDEFQLGFILTHDDSTNARIWKSFPCYSNAIIPGYIYFDYDNIKEADIDDMLASTYELYNVKNITNFKNKLYISNYKETNFNPDLSTLASKISLSLETDSGTQINYKTLTIRNYSLNYAQNTGLFTLTPNDVYTVLGATFDTCFNINISKLIKTNTTEFANALVFDFKWDYQLDPDLCFIYNIYNNLYDGSAVFGTSWEVNYDNAISCIKKDSQQGSVWFYTVPDGVNYYHPWYYKDLTFVYSSLPANTVTSNKRNNVFFFNQNSRTIHGASSYGCWVAQDSGFDNWARSTIDENIIKEITSKRAFCLAYIEITNGAKVYRINTKFTGESSNNTFLGKINNSNYASKDTTNASEDLIFLYDYIPSLDEPTKDFRDKILNYIYKIFGQQSSGLHSKCIGFTEDGVPVLNLSAITGDSESSKIPVDAVNVVFKQFEYSLDFEDLEVDSNTYAKRVRVSLKTTDYNALVTFNLKSSCYSVTDSGSVDQKSTLMPASTYKFYLHFVDDKNIITNGIEKATITTPCITSGTGSIYLSYSISNLSNVDLGKYKAFFISAVNCGNIIAECFNYRLKGTTHIVNCLEADTLLYTLNDNIKIYKGSGNTKTLITQYAKYYSSGSSYPILAFGNCGYISWESSQMESNVTVTDEDYIFIEIAREVSKENSSLIKVSHYMSLTSNVSAILHDAFYGSYLCSVKKPDFVLSSRCYVAGNDVYAINRDVSLELRDFKSYVSVQNSPTYFVRSNFNLNYLSTTEDIPDKIFSIGGASSGIKQVAKVLNSATLSYIYDLKGMYKTFMNKYFRARETDYRDTFDNTVRISNVLSDETFNNSIFTFKSTDYYNVPTDRGIIVSLFSIGNNIFVHTKGSLYKFDGNQTITANDKDITLQESEPFDAGITQILDSRYGYGGIDNKEAGCITFDSYFFYDKQNNHIFAYGGNSQIQIIDAPIRKFLDYIKPNICRTLHDDANNRVLFEFVYTSNNSRSVCISYNYKSKSFVSFHDLKLDNAFASRIKCYYYVNVGTDNTNFSSLFDSDTISTDDLDYKVNTLKLYGLASRFANIQIATEAYTNQDTPFQIAIVMFPTEYVRETINNIKYIANIVESRFGVKQVSDSLDPQIITTYDTVQLLEEIVRDENDKATNPVKSMYIVTDNCLSNKINSNVDETDRSGMESNPPIPNSLTDYKGFRFDVDSWNANYFRNIRNVGNVYEYPGETGAGSPGQPRVDYRKSDSTIATAVPNSDNYSLVYGKYFVIVFNFIKENPIKFEQLFISTTQY